MRARRGSGMGLRVETFELLHLCTVKFITLGRFDKIGF